MFVRVGKWIDGVKRKNATAGSLAETFADGICFSVSLGVGFGTALAVFTAVLVVLSLVIKSAIGAA